MILLRLLSPLPPFLFFLCLAIYKPRVSAQMCAGGVCLELRVVHLSIPIGFLPGLNMTLRQ